MNQSVRSMIVVFFLISQTSESQGPTVVQVCLCLCTLSVVWYFSPQYRYHVGGPEDNDLVESIVGLEVADVLAQLIHLLLLGSREDVVGTLTLVGGDKVWEVNSLHGLDLLHVRVELVLEVNVKDLGTLHGVTEVHAVNVPSVPDDLAGVDHWQHVLHGRVDGISVHVVSELDGRCHHDGSPVVGLLGALLGVPGDSILVGDGTGDASAVSFANKVTIGSDCVMSCCVVLGEIKLRVETKKDDKMRKERKTQVEVTTTTS